MLTNHGLSINNFFLLQDLAQDFGLLLLEICAPDLEGFSTKSMHFY